MENKKTILLVEDNRIIALSEKKTLERGGYIAEIAYNGKEAIEAVKSDPAIDMILMDIDLGKGMDGTEAAEIILKDHDIPIVFHSNHTEKGIVDKTRKITNYGYIVKNSGETVLFASIDMAFKLHNAHTKLKDSESRYRYLADNSSDVIWIMDFNMKFTYISPSIFRQYGITAEEVMEVEMDDYILPPYADKIRSIISDELSKPLSDRTSSFIVEFQQYRRDGTIEDVEANVTWIYDSDGNPVGFQGSNRDISDRKKMEQALRESEAKYRLIIENLYDVIYSLDLNGIVTYISPNVQRYGYEMEEVLGHSMLEFIHPDDHSMVMEKYQEGIIKGEGGPLNIRMFKKGGDIVWVWETARVVRSRTGNIRQIVGILRDRTEQKQTEKALNYTEAKYRLIVENIYDVISVTNREGIILYVSSNVERYGYLQDDIIGRHLIEFVHEGDKKKVIDTYLKSLETGKEYPFDFRMLKKDGTVVWASGASRLILEDNNEVKEVVTILKDITDRKNAEDAHKEIEEIFRLFMEYSPVYVFFKDENIRSIQLSKNYEKMLQKPIDELLGKNMFELFPSELAKKMVEDDLKILREGKPIEVVEEYNKKFYTTTKFPINLDGSYQLLAGFTIDITEQKRAEEQLKQVLAEKELLIKEVHHRVKNNLDIISSLLGIQADYLDSDKAKDALLDSQNRVNSMKFIYDKLYQTEDITDIDIKSYFDELIDTLFKTYNVGLDKIELKLQISDVKIEVKKAIPCGFIINELVSNSLKYAFPDNRTGKIYIGLDCNGKEKISAEDESSHQIQLIVSDNGIGLPLQYDLENSTGFGLQMVGLLVDQLEGAIEIKRESGTEYQISF